jgi:ankyrin repeat protein
MIASHDGNIDIVRLLLEYKADVNQTAENGVTALYIASSYGKPDIVRLLLEHKADASIRAKGRSPYNAAKTQEIKNILSGKNNRPVVVNNPAMGVRGRRKSRKPRKSNRKTRRNY